MPSVHQIWSPHNLQLRVAKSTDQIFVSFRSPEWCFFLFGTEVMVSGKGEVSQAPGGENSDLMEIIEYICGLPILCMRVRLRTSSDLELVRRNSLDKDWCFAWPDSYQWSHLCQQLPLHNLIKHPWTGKSEALKMVDSMKFGPPASLQMGKQMVCRLLISRIIKANSSISELFIGWNYGESRSFAWKLPRKLSLKLESYAIRGFYMAIPKFAHTKYHKIS